MCIICEKKLTIMLLETAHLKPRCLLNNNEKMGLHNIEGYNKQPGSVEKQQYKIIRRF